jgi:hypothetical protein
VIYGQWNVKPLFFVHSRRFIRRCKQGVLQFVILKPILVLAAFILYYFHLYEDGSFSPGGGYLYITLIYFVSYSGGLGSLVLFYVACKDLLMPFRALPKFVLVKSVVFLTYWQVSCSKFTVSVYYHCWAVVNLNLHTTSVFIFYSTIQ